MTTDLAVTIVAWSGAIAGTAAAFKAVGWFWRTSIIPSWSTARRVASAAARLAAIGDASAWPNGSSDLPSFLHGLHKLLTDHVDDHSRHRIEAQTAEIDRAAGLVRERLDADAAGR